VIHDSIPDSINAQREAVKQLRRYAPMMGLGPVRRAIFRMCHLHEFGIQRKSESDVLVVSMPFRDERGNLICHAETYYTFTERPSVTTRYTAYNEEEDKWEDYDPDTFERAQVALSTAETTLLPRGTAEEDGSSG
jgi:hypothetical protein